MIITPIPVKLILPASPVARSEGIHVSGIIRSIAVEMGILKQELAEEAGLSDIREITDQTHLLRILIGIAWEEFYIGKVLKSEGILDHPGEVELDGIHMSPDGESLDVIITRKPACFTKKYQGGLEDQSRTHAGKALRVHEIKATYKSTNTVGDMSKEWMYLTQLKAYCKGRGTRYGELHILFLCGDYSYPIKPLLRRWQLEFTQHELDSNWELLRDYRDQRQ